MFTWICPTCGREVPPSYTECPDCVGKTAQTAAAPPPPQPQQAAAPPPPQGYVPASPVRPAMPPPPYDPTPYVLPPPVRRPGIPTWAMTILFAFAIFGVVA